jgi:MFS family permease
MIPNTWVIAGGRLLYGFCAGVFLAAGPKILNETVPNHLWDYFGASTNLAINLFVLVSMLNGIAMPDGEALKTTNYWQIVYGSPIILIIIMLLMNMFVHTEDSLYYHVQSG